eukprot:CAMPEP_0194173328 /NCGR_PEP_ID=MMETSP0154-20130528/7679_1 /TAXON_ID=1049557 /ORGANISM="Thalassiothrix antarctica, Strain L6-D1" /LENGTH=356 /DNA_ID=CAMNT_0038886349 /DNA_START=27 /DNA_END=1097 /DNA_ORIENTATION=-
MNIFFKYLAFCVINAGGSAALSAPPPGGMPGIPQRGSPPPGGMPGIPQRGSFNVPPNAPAAPRGSQGQRTVPSTQTQQSQDLGGFLKPVPSTDFVQEEMIDPPEFEMFPVFPSLETVQGGGTVRTYKLPVWSESCQYCLETEGRPLKATVNLWIGPIRTTHTLTTDVENGHETPISSTLKFKKNIGPVLKISTSSSYDLPIECGVYVPNPDRARELADNTDRVWETSKASEKIKIQGGSTHGGGGAVRYWKIPASVKSVQLLGWSKDVGKKSFKLDVEVLQGPNNRRQFYYLQCGGSTQPYHAVIQTPGKGSVIRIRNKKFVEDGLVQVSITPYETVSEEKEGGDGFLKALPTQRG